MLLQTLTREIDTTVLMEDNLSYSKSHQTIHKLFHSCTRNKLTHNYFFFIYTYLSNNPKSSSRPHELYQHQRRMKEDFGQVAAPRM